MDTFSSFALMLGLTALLAVINERFLRLQPTIGLMLLASVAMLVLTGLKHAGLWFGLAQWERLVETIDLSDALLNGVLCFMLFAGSASVRIQGLRRERWLIGTLALVSTPAACVLTGFLLHGILGLCGVSLPLPFAFVFGALIAPTDPIAALAILKAAGLPRPLEDILNGESLFNDGIGVVLFTVALAAASEGAGGADASAVGLLLREILGGVGLGLLVAFLTHHALLHAHAHATQLLVSLATVALGYSVALRAGVSGPIAMVVAGLMVGNITTRRLPEEVRTRLATLWDGLDDLLDSLLFVMIGLLVIVVEDLSWAPLAISIPIAIGVSLLARALSVYVPLAVLNATSVLDADCRGLTALLTWGGLRGGLALALALSLPQSPEKDLLVNLTYGVVAFSILVQGLSIGRLFKPAYIGSLLKE